MQAAGAGAATHALRGDAERRHVDQRRLVVRESVLMICEEIGAKTAPLIMDVTLVEARRMVSGT